MSVAPGAGAELPGNGAGRAAEQRAGAQPEPAVDVVVLNWNGLDDTVGAVESLLRQEYAGPVRIRVVDNASARGEADVLEARFGARIVLHRNAQNLGFTGGNAVGMRAAVGDPEVAYVALLNNDAEAGPGWLRALVAEAESDPSVGVVASTMAFFDAPDVVENTGIRLLTSGQAVPRDRGRAVDDAVRTASRHPLGACGGAVLYRAEMLRAIGLFEDSYFANFEDVELSLRALATGWDVRYAPAAVVRHKLSRSIRKVRDDAFLLRSQRNNLHAIATRLPWQVLLVTLPSLVLGELLLLFGAPLAGQWRMARVVWRSRLRFVAELPAVLAERRRFGRLRAGSWRRVWRRQTGFLPFFVRSFRDIVLTRRRRFFE